MTDAVDLQDIDQDINLPDPFLSAEIGRFVSFPFRIEFGMPDHGDGSVSEYVVRHFEEQS